MKYFALFVALAALLIGMAMVISPVREADTAQAVAMPWQIEAPGDGSSRVFGLTLGTATLADARHVFGKDAQVAIILGSGESGTLEAYYDLVIIGPLTGKLILTLDVAPEAIAAMTGRASKAAYMEGNTRKIALAPDDLQAAERLPLRALSLIPSANLDEATLLQRFGPPAERIRASEHVEHFLYPGKGLDVVLDAKGKEVLQYVAPRRFALLREPLRR